MLLFVTNLGSYRAFEWIGSLHFAEGDARVAPTSGRVRLAIHPQIDLQQG